MTETAAEATSTAQDNTVTWWELPVRDLEQAQAFYGEVFGWTFQPFGEGYQGIFNGLDMIGGLFEAPDKVGTVGVRVYVNVPDLEATLAAVERAGGTVTVPRTEIGGDMGWWAELNDAGGSWLGLCTGRPAN